MFPNTKTQVQATDPTIRTIPMDTKNITENNHSKMLHSIDKNAVSLVF